MDSVIRLLDDAHMAGLSLWRDGDKLVIRGPKSAGPVAERVIERKPDVLRLLPAEPLHCVGCDRPIDVDATDWRPTPFDGLVHLDCWAAYGARLAHKMGHA